MLEGQMQQPLLALLLSSLRSASALLQDGHINRERHREMVLEIAERGFGATTYLLWRERCPGGQEMDCLAARVAGRSATAKERNDLAEQFAGTWKILDARSRYESGVLRHTCTSKHSPCSIFFAPFSLNGRVWGGLFVRGELDGPATADSLTRLAQLAVAISIQVSRIDRHEQCERGRD